MKRRLTSILLFSALLVGGASTLVSCKDHDCDQSLYDADTRLTAELSSQATTITNLANQLAAETSSRETQDEILRGLINTNATAIANAAQDARDALAKAGANATTISEIQTTLLQLQSQLAAYADLATRLGTAEGDIAKLQEQIAGLTGDYDITEMNKKLAELEAKQKTDSARITAIEEGKTTLEEQLQKINATLTGGEGQLSYDQVKAQVEANKSKIAALESKVNDINNKFAEYVKEAYTEELNAAIKKASDSLKSEIKDVEDKLTEQLNKLFNAMANEVTSVVVNSFYSPVLGSYKDMIGTQARFLGAYYGTAEGTVKIGTETIYANTQLVDEETGANAGTIGVYINPANKDFSGLTFKIVDSQGKETPFTATVTKSTKVEQYGYTRAESATPNYYLLKVNVAAGDIEKVKTWTSDDVNALKDVAQGILNKFKNSGNSISLSEMANTLYKTLNNRLTEYHLALPQTLTDGTNTALNVTIADKDFAATAIKPLSYDFLKNGIDYTIQDIPTLESKGLYIDTSKLKWSDLGHIDDITKTIDIEIPDANSVTIDNKQVEITAEGKLVWKDDKNKQSIDDLQGVEVNVNGIKFNAGALKFNTTTKTITVTIDMDQFNKMIDEINRQVGNMLGTVEDLAGKVNKYVNTIDGNIINRINDYIHKCNSLLDNVNKFLQPAMFATDGTNWVKLPTIANGATYVKMSNGKADVLLLPTSYTLEYIAPAYKKYITVTAPDGTSVTGDNVGTVISGNVRKAGFTATKAGVYTITYEAVDYSGAKRSSNFFVQVVE